MAITERLTGEQHWVTRQYAFRKDRLVLMVKVEKSGIMNPDPDVFGHVTSSESYYREATMEDIIELKAMEARGAKFLEEIGVSPAKTLQNSIMLNEVLLKEFMSITDNEYVGKGSHTFSVKDIQQFIATYKDALL